MSQVAFDTLAYANKLKHAGVDSTIAEAHAQIQAEVLSDWMNANLATKEDIKELRFEIHATTERLRNELHDELHEFRDEFRSELHGLRNEFREEFCTKQELFSEMERFRIEIRNSLKLFENRMTIRLGVMMMSGLTLLATLIKFLHL